MKRTHLFGWPSEAARALSPEDWRGAMPSIHAAVDGLVRDGSADPATFEGRPLPRRSAMRYRAAMARRKRYLTATMADGYVKTIGPTAAPFTHYWRIVAYLHDGKTEVFWGHANSAQEAAGKKVLTEQAAKRHGWKGFDFEIAALTEH